MGGVSRFNAVVIRSEAAEPASCYGMDNAPTPSVCRIALLAPLIFAAHVVEEAPGFVEWANSLLEEDITQRLFFAVNTVGFAVTAALAVNLSLGSHLGREPRRHGHKRQAASRLHCFARYSGELGGFGVQDPVQPEQGEARTTVRGRHLVGTRWSKTS